MGGRRGRDRVCVCVCEFRERKRERERERYLFLALTQLQRAWCLFCPSMINCPMSQFTTCKNK